VLREPAVYVAVPLRPELRFFSASPEPRTVDQLLRWL